MVPDDPALPALVAARSRGMESVLADCGVLAPVRSVRPLRHHQGSRCVLEVVAEGRRFAVKAFRRDPAKRAVMLTRLAQAGLAAPGGPSITVLAGHDAGLACLVLEWLEGEPAATLLADGRGARAGELAGQWLSAAATVGGEGLEDYAAAQMAADLRGWVAVIAAADAGYGRQAADVAERLEDDPPPTGRQALLHLSFSVNHVVDLGDGPGVLDWDDPGYGPLELDAGAFLASLRRHAGLYPDRAEQAAAAAETMLAATGDLLDPGALDWFRRGALVKHAKHACKRQRPGWSAVAGGLLAEAA